MWWLPLALAAEGTVALTPESVPVDAKVTLELTYTVGAGGMQLGDALVVEDPIFHGMRWARWGHLVTDPESCTPFAEPSNDSKTPSSAGLVTARTEGEAELAVNRNLESASLHTRGETTVLVASGTLEAGDEIVVVVGDTSEGEDCGLQSSVRAFDHVPWRVFERLDGLVEELVGEPTFSFSAEGEPASLLVSAPSQALAEEPFLVRVAVLDARGNALRGHEEPVLVGEQELQPTGGVAVFEVEAEAGIERLVATSGGLEGLSNPVEVAGELPEQRIFWGDLHTHHGHHYEDDGELVDQNHAYGRDVAGLQIGCESVKGSPHELDSLELWEEQQRACEAYTVDGAYVALLGFEWMGNEVAPGEEGHHNVYYDGCEGPLGEAALSGLEDRDGEEGLWSFMERAEAEHGVRSVSVPHASSYTGYNWNDRDDEKRPLAEIYSEWGASDDQVIASSLRAGTYVGLAEGHRMGLIGASDNHDGWLGNRWGYKNDYAGLGAYLAPELTRAAIFESLRARSTYATTGHRPILRFSAEDGAEVPMGAAYVAEAPSFSWRYHGETTVALVELLGVVVGGEVEVLESWKPESEDAEGSHALAWEGARQAVWLYVEEADGEEAWSSPIWLSDCDDPDAVDVAGRCDGDTGDPPDSDPRDSGPEDDTAAGDSGDSGRGCPGCGGGGLGWWPLAPLWLLGRFRARAETPRSSHPAPAGDLIPTTCAPTPPPERTADRRSGSKV